MKKSKKFVLAALALLAAITMVLLPLAGCKNDTVPEPIRYTVSFDKGDNSEYTGDLPADITVVSGTKLTAEQLEVLDSTDNYIFEYWYDKDGDAQKPVEEGYTVTKDVTLVAKWRDRGTVVPVTFSPASGDTLYYGDTVTLSTTTDGATIQYKLDDGEWMDYTVETPISVTTSTTITARATKDGLKPSAVTSATYTVRQLEGISVTTPPARTVYNVGEEVVHNKGDEIQVTATYDDGEERTVTGTITTDTSTLTESAGIGKTVTVSYSEGGSPVTKDFTVDVVNVEEPTKLTSYSSPNHTGSEWTYVAFGEWPQTEAVDFNPTTTPKSHGIFVDNYYVEGNDKYVKEDGKYYKVEPIVWRVLTTNFTASVGGNALLLAESILTGGIPYYVSSDLREITKEKETWPVTVLSNNWQYSTIRAWLNGLDVVKGDGQEHDTTYTDKGFLQTAFTESARKLIAPTTVDNTDWSFFGTGESFEFSPHDSNKVNTTDRIFLLSQQEATTDTYGFAAYSESGPGSTRIRVITDYAKATGVSQAGPLAGSGGSWWLRSPHYILDYVARIIINDGDASYVSANPNVHHTFVGVVPALSISLGGN